MRDLDGQRWRILEQYLDRALELEPHERMEWLASLERDEPDSAARVRELLSRRERPGFASFLEGSAAPTVIHASPGDLAGRSIGAYILESELGRGGMGSVWLARRADGQYEAKAAIKLLHTPWSGPERHSRFRREGQLLARLDHPNIARLFDAGVADGSQPYLVLEYVQGERIDRWCDSRRLDVHARIRLFLRVLSAVAHAHRHLVVHRDIKPTNILVTEDGTPKLLDFGIGKLAEGDGDSALTLEGRHAMTLEYAAPEQVRGEPVTTATDVHALGLVLYELLAGRHAYASAERSGSPMELMRRVLEEEPPKPSTVVLHGAGVTSVTAAQRGMTPHTLRRTLQGDIDNIVAKALRKNPSERYASVGALAEDLRRYLEHEPVTARPTSAGYRVVKFVRRHRRGVASGGLLLLTLIAASAITTTQMVEARRQRDEARFQMQRAESANEFLNALLQTEGAPGRPAPTGTDRLELGVRMLESQYRDDPRFAGRMLVQLGRQFRGNAATDRSVGVIERGYELGRASGDLELMALARCSAAYAEALGDASEHAVARIAEAKQYLERLEAPSIGLRADCLQAEGVLAERRGDPSTGVARLTEARRLLEEAGETHRAAYTSVLNDIGGVYLRSNRLADALAMAELAGATHERYGRGGTTARLTILQNESAVLDGLGEARLALERRSAVISRSRELDGDGAPPFVYLGNQANTLNELARPAEALSVLADSVTSIRATGNRGLLARALLSTGWAYTQLGQLREAATALDESAEIAARNPAGNRELLVRIEARRAELELKRGETTAARRKVAAALEIDGYPAARATRGTRELLVVAAETALREERFDSAASYADAALAIAEAVARSDDSSAHVGEGLLLAARARLGLGERDVRPLLERAVRCLTNGYGADHPRTREARDLLANPLSV